MLTYKLLVAIPIFLLAFGCGVLPLVWRHKRSFLALLNYGEFFARGVFLGAGLMHLLPESVTMFRKLYPNLEYSFAGLIVALVVWLLFILEQGVSSFFQKRHFQFLPFLLVAVLSIHALIEGLVLGADDSPASFYMVLLAIIAHKGAEAFALGVNISRLQLSQRLTLWLVGIFALMTPIGILGGNTLITLLHGTSGHLTEAIFNSVAAGTFIYMATIDNHHSDEEHHHTSTLLETTAYGLGLAIMAIAAWVI